MYPLLFILYNRVVYIYIYLNIFHCCLWVQNDTQLLKDSSWNPHPQMPLLILCSHVKNISDIVVLNVINNCIKYKLPTRFIVDFARTHNEYKKMMRTRMSII